MAKTTSGSPSFKNRASQGVRFFLCQHRSHFKTTLGLTALTLTPPHIQPPAIAAEPSPFSHTLTVPAATAALAARLEARDSATAALQETCSAPITAKLIDTVSPPQLVHDARQLLSLKAHTAITTRHVQLFCRNILLSEAWNIYIPALLLPTARQRLAGGHIPFGRALGESFFQRHRLQSRFHNLPFGIVLENRAILYRRDTKQPFSFLIERYTRAALLPKTKPFSP